MKGETPVPGPIRIKGRKLLTGNLKFVGFRRKISSWEV